MAYDAGDRPIRIAAQVQPQHARYAQIRDTVAELEDLGVDAVFNWDHFFPLSGDADGEHYESWTMLAAWAEATERVRRRIADPEVAVTVAEASEPSPESPADGAQFALIAEALAVSHPGVPAVPYVMMAATDSRHFHRFSPAVYRFAPLEMSSAQRAAIHGVDERVEIAALERGERFHRALLERLP